MSTFNRSGTKKRKVSELDASPDRVRSEKHYDEGGDVEIVSSDGVAFKVKAFYLQASSSVFRDMVEIGSASLNNAIELSDLESQYILDKVFSILISNKPFLGFSRRSYEGIIGFLKKYDFERELEHIRLSIHTAAGNKEERQKLIFAASHLGDWNLCGEVVAKAGGSHTAALPTDRQQRFGERIPSRHIFDMRSWAAHEMELLPRRVFWALLRASEARSGVDYQWEGDNKAMSVEFLRLMALEGAPAVHR